MDIILALINSLKLNESIALQFILFLIAYIALYYVLFKPYNNVAQARYDKTVGSEESSSALEEEIELLKRKYGDKVKETNIMVKDVFKDFDQKTKTETVKILEEAQKNYLAVKKEKESQIEQDFQAEKSKVPSLINELKNSLKKVLIGAE